MDVPAAAGGERVAQVAPFAASTRGGAGGPEPASEDELTHAELAGNTPVYAIHGNTPLVGATLTGAGRWGWPGAINTNS